MEKFKENYQKCFNAFEQKLGTNNSMFLNRIYGEGITKYINRIEAIDFVGNEHVLDAGCGFGQWSIALSMKNKQVSACDISPLRTGFLKELSQSLEINNIEIETCELNELLYKDNTFDAVFCYSVIFLTPWKQSLKELARVLKPGGKLYVNANGLGWYCFLWNEQNNATSDYDPQATAAKSLADTLIYEREGIYKEGMSIIIEPEQLKKELIDLGFQNIHIAPEGTLHLNKNSQKPTPFFKGQYYGLEGIFEVIANK